MNKTLLRTAFAAASVFALAGCAGNPLVGTWVAQLGGSTLNTSATLTLNADGTASTNTTVTGGTVNGMTVTCTGPGVSNTGLRWTSTATTITVNGTPTCTGSVTCMVAGMSQELGCSTGSMMTMSSGIENAPYTLSGNNNTLTLSITSNGMTTMQAFTRRN
jgi:hypothetical protein